MTPPICIDIHDTGRLYALAKLAAVAGYSAVASAAHVTLRNPGSKNLHQLYCELRYVPEAERAGWPIYDATERAPAP